MGHGRTRFKPSPIICLLVIYNFTIKPQKINIGQRGTHSPKTTHYLKKLEIFLVFKKDYLFYFSKI